MKKKLSKEINYTAPKITIPRNKKKGRVYVSYHYEGVRYRHYNGNSLALKIYPNRCADEKDKLRQLNLLKSKFNEALKSGWAPTEEIITIPILREALTQILADKLGSNLSSTYKKNLVGIHKLFTKFLLPNELNRTYDHLKLHRVEEFLNTFRSSERNYINRRRCLGVFFNEIVRREWGKSNLASRTPPAKAKAILHIPYHDDQLKQLLNFLKKTSPNLYLCCLLTYGCLLRPHREILRLKRKHITEDLSQIMLSGNDTFRRNLGTGSKASTTPKPISSHNTKIPITKVTLT